MEMRLNETIAYSQKSLQTKVTSVDNTKSKLNPSEKYLEYENLSKFRIIWNNENIISIQEIQLLTY